MERVPSDDRRVAIVHVAAGLWYDFLDAFGGKFTNESLFKTYLGGPRHCLFAFATFCGQLYPGAREVLIYRRNVSGFATNRSGRPISWLCDMNVHGPEPAIVVDYDHLNDNWPDVRRDRGLVMLVLHEVGHLVFHWDSLTNRRANAAGRARRRLPGATAQEEAEAWWFSYGVLAAAMADYAHAHTSHHAGGRNDPTWTRI